MHPQFQGGAGVDPKRKAFFVFLVPILYLPHTEAVMQSPELGLGLHISCLSCDATVQPTGLGPSYNPYHPGRRGTMHLPYTILLLTVQNKPTEGWPAPAHRGWRHSWGRFTALLWSLTHS